MFQLLPPPGGKTSWTNKLPRLGVGNALQIASDHSDYLVGWTSRDWLKTALQMIQATYHRLEWRSCTCKVWLLGAWWGVDCNVCMETQKYFKSMDGMVRDGERVERWQTMFQNIGIYFALCTCVILLQNPSGHVLWRSPFNWCLPMRKGYSIRGNFRFPTRVVKERLRVPKITW